MPQEAIAIRKFQSKVPSGNAIIKAKSSVFSLHVTLKFDNDLEMDKSLHLTLHWAGDYLSMLG